jgi:hypothetical protein
VKGKYAARAARRREFTGLEERAVAAERDRDRLAVELAELHEKSDEKIATLRAGVTEAREQRDTASAPRIAQLEEVCNRLRAERNSALDQERFLIDNQRVFEKRMRTYLRDNLGLSVIEAKELVIALWDAPAIGERWVSPAGISGKDSGAAEAVQRARGMRGKGNRAAAAAPDVPAIVRPFARRGEVKRLRDVAVKELVPVYAYDGPESSLVLSADEDQSLRIYIEHAEADVLTNAGLAGIRIPAEERAKLANAVRAQEEPNCDIGAANPETVQ